VDVPAPSVRPECCDQLFPMELLDQPLARAEYLAVDVETNGLGGDLCELTEVGTVLVGGGELHDSWESLVRVERPLSRGIERFTGITQQMVDTAPPPEEVLPLVSEQLADRVLVAHSARFDDGVLRQVFERYGIDWPEPPVLCTVALARRFAPLARRRGLGSLADTLGIEVETVHRALPDALTCARIFCALFPKLCANAVTVSQGLALLRPRRRRDAVPGRPRPKEERPDLSRLPDDPGVYIFRDERGRPLYVGKSVSLRSRARSHFCAPAGWTERADVVDYRSTNSELGALVLENRLIKSWRPPGNRKLKRTDGYVYLRARLDIAYPVIEVDPEPAPGLALNVGPVRGKALARELADQLNSLFQLRQCGRRLKLREHPSAYGQMGRCLSPCLGDLDPNLYRRRLDEAFGLFDGDGGGERLLALLDERMRAASAGLRYERAAALLRRRDRLEWVLARLEGVLRAVNGGARLVLAAHPSKERFDAFWIAGGRVVDWGPLPGLTELEERTAAVRAAVPRSRSPIRPEEVDEVRIVSAWLAGNEPPALQLEPPPARGALARFASSAAVRPSSAASFSESSERSSHVLR
jgi:DNA polymerase III subunit epsilon